MTGVRIKPHRPLRSAVVVSLLTVATGVAVYLHQQHATQALRSELEVTAIAHRQLQRDARALARNNDELRKQLTVLTRERQVERIAYDKIDERLRSLQSTVHALKEEVAFYQGIIASDAEKGVQVQSLSVDPDGRERGYRFQLVLTRAGKSDMVTAGSASISVSGEHGGSLADCRFRTCRRRVPMLSSSVSGTFSASRDT